jgi:hypothetical protein
VDVSRSGQSLAEQKIAVAATRAALLKYSHGMPAVLGLLEITASLAPPILVDDICKRYTANWPEPTYGVADRQQGIRVDARWQSERGLRFLLELQIQRRQSRAKTEPHLYLDRTKVTILRVIPLSGQFGFTRHGDNTCSRSPSTVRDRTCSVPTHSGIHATSTLVVHLSPSTR